MPAVRRASVTWEGNLVNGRGRVSANSSGLFSDLGVSWPSRNEEPNGNTSPEELLAAAHASCFAMALSSRLAKAGTPPERLDITASVTFDSGRVASSVLEVRAVAPGTDEETLRSLAEDAKNNCPISKALAGNVDLSVSASLASS